MASALCILGAESALGRVLGAYRGLGMKHQVLASSGVRWSSSRAGARLHCCGASARGSTSPASSASPPCRWEAVPVGSLSLCKVPSSCQAPGQQPWLRLLNSCYIWIPGAWMSRSSGVLRLVVP